MDVASTAGAIVAFQTGLLRQELAMQALKQSIDGTAAAVGLVAAAVEQSQQATAAAVAPGERGGIVDITV